MLYWISRVAGIPVNLASLSNMICGICTCIVQSQVFHQSTHPHGSFFSASTIPLSCPLFSHRGSAVGHYVTCIIEQNSLARFLPVFHTTETPLPRLHSGFPCGVQNDNQFHQIRTGEKKLKFNVVDYLEIYWAIFVSQTQHRLLPEQ